MRYLDIYKQPKKFLNDAVKTNKDLVIKILSSIENLRENPLPSSAKKLVGHKDLYRIRIGKYRIVYSFDKLELRIVLIKNRDDVYLQLDKFR